MLYLAAILVVVFAYCEVRPRGPERAGTARLALLGAAAFAVLGSIDMALT